MDYRADQKESKYDAFRQNELFKLKERLPEALDWNAYSCRLVEQSKMQQQVYDTKHNIVEANNCNINAAAKPKRGKNQGASIIGLLKHLNVNINEMTTKHEGNQCVKQRQNTALIKKRMENTLSLKTVSIQ